MSSLILVSLNPWGTSANALKTRAIGMSHATTVHVLIVSCDLISTQASVCLKDKFLFITPFCFSIRQISIFKSPVIICHLAWIVRPIRVPSSKAGSTPFSSAFSESERSRLKSLLADQWMNVCLPALSTCTAMRKSTLSYRHDCRVALIAYTAPLTASAIGPRRCLQNV